MLVAGRLPLASQVISTDQRTRVHTLFEYPSDTKPYSNVGIENEFANSVKTKNNNNYLRSNAGT